THMTSTRRTLILGALAFAALPVGAPFRTALAAPRAPVPPDVAPPMDSAEAFIAWMKDNRGENPEKLAERYARYQAMIQNKDLWTPKEYRAFLLTPREEFALQRNYKRAYEHNFLDIGYGV